MGRMLPFRGLPLQSLPSMFTVYFLVLLSSSEKTFCTFYLSCGITVSGRCLWNCMHSPLHIWLNLRPEHVWYRKKNKLCMEREENKIVISLDSPLEVCTQRWIRSAWGQEEVKLFSGSVGLLPTGPHSNFTGPHLY